MAVLTGPGYLSPQFVVGNDGMVSLTSPPLPIAGPVTITGPVVIKTNTAPSLPAPPGGTLLQLGGVDGGGTRIVLDAFGGGTNSPMLQFRAAGGTAAARTPTQSGDTLGNIIWQGYGTTGIPVGGKAQLNVYATQTWTDTATGTAMSFFVTPNGGVTQVEALRIADNGNVGIGTTTPAVNTNNSRFLTLDASALGVGPFSELSIGGNITSTAAAVGGLNFFNAAIGGADKRISNIFGQTDGAINSGNLLFWTANAGTPAERMRITATGNVGIGKPDPGGKLDVYGTILSTGTGPSIVLSQTGTSASNTITSYKNGAARWLLAIGDGTTEGGSNSGSNLSIARFDDTSTYLGNAVTILRSSGNVGIGVTAPSGRLHVLGVDTSVIGLISGSTKAVRFGSDSTSAWVEAVDQTGVSSYQPLYVGGSTVTLRCNASPVLTVNGNAVGINTTTPRVELEVVGSSLGPNIAMTDNTAAVDNRTWDWYLTGGALQGRVITDNYASGTNWIEVYRTGITPTTIIFPQGTTQNLSGAWVVISDASVKQDVVPYMRGLDAVLALNPVQFRYAAGTPFAEVDAPSRLLFGLMADEVESHVPEIVGST